MIIHTLDPVWTECDEEAANMLRNLLSYKVVRWEKTHGKPRRFVEKEFLVEGWEYGKYVFLSGFVPKALKYLKKHGIRYKYTTDVPVITCKDPHIPGVDFRGYQFGLINDAIDAGYGVIVAPTGSGKSYIINGIISAFPNSNILVLVHTVDLVHQLHAGFTAVGFESSKYNETKKIDRITISTVQTYHKVARKLGSMWDVVLVDEGHHVSNPKSGMYYTALAYCAAPIRLAFTATESDSEEQRAGLEGLIGPVVGKLTMEEGQSMGFLAEAEIIFRVCPLPDDKVLFKGETAYTTKYRIGVVDNFNRNNRIVVEAEREVENGGVVLILVKHVRHMNRIENMMDIPVEIVKGAVKKEDRVTIKEDLKSGKSQCVIATTAWVEGIDIPNLTMVINAGGGVSEKETLQKIGRGLRKTETKDRVKIIDFMDVSDTSANPFGKCKGGKHLLHKQSITRWDIYKAEGWKPELR